MMINKILKLKLIFSVTKFPGGSPYLKQYFTETPLKFEVKNANRIEDNLDEIAIKIQSEYERLLPHIAHISSRSQADLFLRKSKNLNILNSSKQFYYKHGNIHKYYSTTAKTNLIRGQPTPRIFCGGDFKELITESTTFVDKSLFVKEIMDDINKVILITMPRRWGKSLNFDMLKRFLEISMDDKFNPVKDKTTTDNYKLFAGGKIDVDYGGNKKEKVLSELKLIKENPDFLENQGNSPVIYIDFKNCKNDNYSGVLELVKLGIIEAYDRHSYLKGSEKTIKYDLTIKDEYIKNLEEIRSGNIYAIKFGLKNLSELLSIHFDEKVWILIDEYDAAANNAYMKFEDIKEAQKVADLFKTILEPALKGNPYLEKGVLTGVQYILKSGILSGLNNISKHNITSEKYAKYYGINNEEMNDLLRAFSIGEEQKSKIKDWYNGYREYIDDKNFQDKYNIWSVVNYLNRQSEGFISYWGESGQFEFIAPLLKKQEFKENIESLIYGESLSFGELKDDFTVNDFQELKKITRLNDNSKITPKGYNLIFSYLFITGYLTVEAGNRYRLPNKELKKVFKSRIQQYYRTIFQFDFKKLEELTDILTIILEAKSENDIKSSIKEFGKGLEQFLEGIKLINKNEVEQDGLWANEDLIHSILNIIAMQVVDSKFGTEAITDITRSKNGRADIFIIKKNSGIIFEIKYKKNSKDALDQAKQYDSLIKNCEKKVFIGCNIDKDKKVSIESEIDLGESATS